MYYQYYRLKENPFNITADPSFFFDSVHHEEAFAHLVYGIQSRKGIMVVTGEIGTGKTTLCRMLLNQLDENIKTALILNPNFSELQLLQLIVKDFGIQTASRNKLDLISRLNEFLLDQSSRGNNVVVIIDEAQNLSVKQLEAVRLLTNLETEKEKLLQIILVGQPELLEKLKLPQLRQLNQRIAVRYHILPLKELEMERYIAHRLKIAGADDRLQFTRDALNAIYRFTQGTPRLINVVCDRALLSGFNHETFTINDDIIRECVKEVH